MVRLVSPIDIALTKYSFKRIVRTVRRIVFFEYIVIASYINSIGSQPGKKESIPTQAGKISSEDVVTGFINDQKPRSICAQMRACLTQIISAAIIGVVVGK